MITAGMDLGSKYIKIVIMNDGNTIARVKLLSGFEQEVTANDAMKEALTQAAIKPEKIERIVATGAGRSIAPFAHDKLTEVGAAARGAIARNPNIRTVIDVGAEEGRAILITSEGRVKDFAINEKCAAGSGTFTEAMARALELGLEEFGKLSLESDKAVPMNAQCAVFAESEVVSLVARNHPKEEIIRGLHRAVVNRVGSMVKTVSVDGTVTMTGGVAKNRGVVSLMEEKLGQKIYVHSEPQIVGALGAALMASEIVP